MVICYCTCSGPLSKLSGAGVATMLERQHREGDNTMHVEFKEMLLELVPDDHMGEKEIGRAHV